MTFQPANTLRSRTYLGLIVAQFLAAFNDQCIHASSMFYAINHGVMSEATAISLMPILFFIPWVLFCTLAGYFADRYSKRQSLVFWKFAEVGITVLALAGFFIGTVGSMPRLGSYIVLSTVFLMGTHSAFFVPAKYGAMPEILQSNLLSKGNGVLESTSFLAVILGTVTGGVLSSDALFKGREQYIGLFLVCLALIGAGASLLIRKMPAANPSRPWPLKPLHDTLRTILVLSTLWIAPYTLIVTFLRALFKPLIDNLRTMVQSRPLVLSILGIAFFTFMVAFMRASMYMHGETRNPRWDEFTTSLVVATVALGVGLGSPLAGFLSGGKVELGLVPLGAVGMIVALLLAAVTIFWNPGLIIALVLIGFFSGFYIVPLYTLLQHRAPKTSKGDLIATSNFCNVTGGIAASVLFFVLVEVAHHTGIAPRVEQMDPHRELSVRDPQVAIEYRGTLIEEPEYRHGRPVFFRIQVQPPPAPPVSVGRSASPPSDPDPDPSPFPWIDPDEIETRRIEVDESLLDVGRGLQQGSDVIVSSYKLPRQGYEVTHYRVRLADQPLSDAYNDERLPRFLFIGAALMTLGILVVLCRQLPDFFVRSLLWLRAWGRYRLRVVGTNNLPSSGPVILSTNCTDMESCLRVISATDRFTRFLMLEQPADGQAAALLRYSARRTSLAVLRSGASSAKSWEQALDSAVRVLEMGEVVGLPAANGSPQELDDFLHSLQKQRRTVILPVYCGSRLAAGARFERVKVVIGEPLPPETPPELIRQEIQRLADSGDKDASALRATTVRIPTASGASPTRPEAGRPTAP
jgi:MFS family permease